MLFQSNLHVLRWSRPVLTSQTAGNSFCFQKASNQERRSRMSYQQPRLAKPALKEHLLDCLATSFKLVNTTFYSQPALILSPGTARAEGGIAYLKEGRFCGPLPRPIWTFFFFYTVFEFFLLPLKEAGEKRSFRSKQIKRGEEYGTEVFRQGDGDKATVTTQRSIRFTR